MRPHASDDSESEPLESDSGVPTISSPKPVATLSLEQNPFFILFGKPGICSDNSQKTQDAGRLFQMRPVYEYFQLSSMVFINVQA
jgi:hypothetical protein